MKIFLKIQLSSLLNILDSHLLILNSNKLNERKETFLLARLKTIQGSAHQTMEHIKLNLLLSHFIVEIYK